MATTRKKTTSNARSGTKTGGSRSGTASRSRASAKNAKRPIRREVGGMVMLLLALIVLVSYFTGDGWLINLIPRACKGLFGVGYYLMVPALMAAAWVLITHRGQPVALRTVAQIAGAVDIPVSGIGGIYNWRDAVEFILCGASSLQVCSAVMHHGYRIINDLTAGLLNYMEEMGFATINDFCGKALPNIHRHNDLSRAYKLYSSPDPDKCVGCGKCAGECPASVISIEEVRP